MKFLTAEFTKNTGETTLDGGEDGSGDETVAKKVVTVQRTMTKKVVTF